MAWKKRGEMFLSSHLTKLAEPEQECLAFSGGRINKRREDQIANPRNLVWALRVSGERRKNQAERYNDCEPDPPHGHLDWDGWRESS